MNKTCPCCQTEKPKSDFYFANKEKTRYAVNCKVCFNKISTERNRENPNRPHIIRRCKYNIEPKEYESMLARQNNSCAICELPSENLCVDHDHTTGKIRGLLCHNCNRGLGSFRDNPLFLKKAAMYLQGDCL